MPISLPLFILYLWQVELENSCSRTRRLLRHSGRVVAASTYQHHQCDDVGFLFLFSLLQENERQPSFIASRNRKIFYKALSRAQRRLRDRRIPRSALKDPYHSAWRTLLQSNNDQAMITLTGLDYETFNWLLARFESLYKNYTPFTEDGRIMKLKGGVKGAGRPRLLSAADCLGLNLAWTRLRGSAIALQIIFGMPGTSVSMYLRFGRRLIIRILKDHPDAALQIPSAQKIAEYQAAIARRHPSLADVWCTMDGLKLYLEQSGDAVIQNMFYNGWTHDHYVSGVFVFCPDGTIPIATYNVPGCFHDSTIADWGNVYNKLKNVYETTGTGGKCTVDSAFSKKRYEFLIKSSQADPDSDDPNDYVVNQEATSMRQAAEWGMRALQSSFPRLKDRIVYEEFGERKIIIKMILLLYNLRARRVGINQILNTYMPELNKDANNLFHC